jgi:hypothetical protein
MCDYSLEHVASRPAVKGERLVTAQFPRTVTRGFASTSDANTAICLLPGTEIVFDRAPKIDLFWFFSKKAASVTAARFRQINVHEPRCHHDALEFSDGKVVLLNHLATGQTATIVQLPRQRVSNSKHEDGQYTNTDRTAQNLSLIGAD